MHRIAKYRFSAALLLALFAVSLASAGQAVVSTMKNPQAVMQARGYYLTPSPEHSGSQYAGDLAPVQAFEIIRPNWEAVTIGRLYTSCTCVRLEAARKSFNRGERAVLTLRNVLATPPAGQTYAIYVQLTRPIRVTLRYDTFVQSSQFIVKEPVVVETVEPETPDDTVEPEIIEPRAVDVVVDGDDAARIVLEPGKDGESEEDAENPVTEEEDARPAEVEPVATEPHDKYSPAEEKEDDPQVDAGESDAGTEQKTVLDISDVIEEKIEESLEDSIDQKLGEKLEGIIEEKIDKVIDEKLDDIIARKLAEKLDIKIDVKVDNNE